MNRELIEYIQVEIKEAQNYFKNDEHFNEVFEQAGWGEDEARLFDCGYIKGLQNALSKLQEYGETE
tara:strand:- start:17 stop:214 length:198 start_codon:yes stop_codon:yes gene_type:complete